MQKPTEYPADMNWLSDEEYEKILGHFRLMLNGIMSPFTTGVNYGMGVYAYGAIEEIIKLAENFGLRVRGVDKIISINPRGDVIR